MMKSVLLLLAFAAVALAVPPNWSNRRAACTDKAYAAAACTCGTGAADGCAQHSKCTGNLCCAPDACTAGKVINAACTCGTVSGCGVGKVINAACTCGTVS